MPCLARQLQASGGSGVWGWAFLFSAPRLCSPSPASRTTGRAVNVEFYLHSFPKNVRAGAKAMPKGSSCFSNLRWSHMAACQLPGPSPHRELRMLCEGLWCAESQRAGTSLRTGSSPWYRAIDAILSTRRRASAPSFITVLLSHCQGSFFGRIVPRKWWNSEFGMWSLKLFIL